MTRDANEEGQAMRTTEFIVRDGEPVAVILDKDTGRCWRGWRIWKT